MSTHIHSSIKAVLFDLDDTLLGTKEPIWKLHKFIAKKYYKKELTDDEIRKHWGIPLSKLLQEVYGTDGVEAAIQHLLDHKHEYPKILFDKTIDTLTRLNEMGIKTGVVTAGARHTLDFDFKHHNFPVEKFDYIQTEDDTSFHKPDPRVFEPAIEWLKEIGIKPKETLYVGDGLHDMKAAVGAGFNFLGVETGLITGTEFKTANAKSIPGIANLLD